MQAAVAGDVVKTVAVWDLLRGSHGMPHIVLHGLFRSLLDSIASQRIPLPLSSKLPPVNHAVSWDCDQG